MKKCLLLLAAALLLTTISATPLLADGNPSCGPRCPEATIQLSAN